MEQLQKQFVKHFILLEIVSLFLNAVFYSYFDLVLALKVFTVPLLLFGSLGYFFSNYPFNFDLVYRLGLYGFGIYVYLIVLVFNFEPVAFALCVPVILAVNINSNIKETILWSIAFLLLASTAPFISDLINIKATFPIPEKQAQAFRYFTIVTCIVFSLFFLFYNKLFTKAQVKLSDQSNNLAKSNSTEKGVETSKKEENNAADLFKKIETYFNAGYGFKAPQYSIDNLANDLSSNTRNISRAIKLNTGMNFKTFLNHQRITVVKQMLNTGDHKRFTLKHLYSSVGFTNQSTFNRVFKEVEGVTPSEFIEKLEQKEERKG